MPFKGLYKTLIPSFPAKNQGKFLFWAGAPQDLCNDLDLPVFQQLSDHLSGATKVSMISKVRGLKRG